MPEEPEEEKASIKVFKEMEYRKGKKIVIGTRDYLGRRYLEARRWFQPNEKNPRWYPTKEGWIVPMEKLSELLGILCDLAESENVQLKGGSEASGT